MRFVATGLAIASLLGMTACAGNPNRPTDTGNMAYPTPVPAGVVGTSRPSGLDTGSMNTPRTTGGVATQDQARPDTGSMALPNRAQGNSGTVRY